MSVLKTFTDISHCFWCSLMVSLVWFDRGLILWCHWCCWLRGRLLRYIRLCLLSSAAGNIRVATAPLFSLLATLGQLDDLVHLDHQLATVLDFFQGVDTVSVNFAEIFKLVLQSKHFNQLHNFRSNVVSIAVKHNFSVHFALFGRVLHKNHADFLELLFWHGLYGFLYHSRAILLLAEFAQVQSNKLIEAANTHVHHFRFPLRHRDKVL